jgi:hypothetical protein
VGYWQNSLPADRRSTQPGSLVTSWNYNPNGYLTSLDGPLAGNSDTTSYTHDLYGRIRTQAEGDGNSVGEGLAVAEAERT